MAVLYIAEYATIGEASKGGIQVPEEPPITEQVVAIGAGSLQSAPFNPKTRLIRVHPDAVCSVLIGTNPVATATNQRFSAGVSEFKALNLQGNPPPSYRIAVITNV